MGDTNALVAAPEQAAFPPGYPRVASVGAAGGALAGGRYSALLLDVELEGYDALLQNVLQRWPGVAVILTAPRPLVARALDGVRSGAHTYLVRPFEPDELRFHLDRLAEADPGPDLSGCARCGLLGRSEAKKRLCRLIRQVACADTTVLLEGESGTGKELVARAIHRESGKRGAFVPINCGAIPRELMESELFGDVRGAFSGAVSDKRGLIREAEAGTLFLDEVGELPTELQVKLLRVLENHEVRPVGGAGAQTVQLRVVAATNRSLIAEVEAGRFREDLFFRLQIFPIHVPPLRERPDDIPDLVAHYLGVFNRRLGKAIEGVDEGALRALERYPWPGNVRELINMLERAMLLAHGRRLTAQCFPGLSGERSPSGFWEPPVEFLSYKDYLESVTERAQRRYFTKVLQRFEGDVQAAADQAGLKRESVYRTLKKLHLRPADFRQ